MIPLLPTCALALVSFASSVFVILRVIIPVLPLSVRVSICRVCYTLTHFIQQPLNKRVPPVSYTYLTHI
jgi:hypothetical protein